MLALELDLEDELSPFEEEVEMGEVQLNLIYPHWRVGTLHFLLSFAHYSRQLIEHPEFVSF
jgi:hypothetical protein